MQVAATALANDDILVTEKRRDVDRTPDLAVESPIGSDDPA